MRFWPRVKLSLPVKRKVASVLSVFGAGAEAIRVSGSIASGCVSGSSASALIVHSQVAADSSLFGSGSA